MLGLLGVGRVVCVRVTTGLGGAQGRVRDVLQRPRQFAGRCGCGCSGAEHDDDGSDRTGGAHPAERSTGEAPRGAGLGLVTVLSGEDDERVIEAGELFGGRLRAHGVREVEQAPLARREVLGCDATVDDGLEPYAIGGERRPGV
jgi:hypothetical protein